MLFLVVARILELPPANSPSSMPLKDVVPGGGPHPGTPTSELAEQHPRPVCTAAGDARQPRQLAQPEVKIDLAAVGALPGEFAGGRSAGGADVGHRRRRRSWSRAELDVGDFGG